MRQMTAISRGKGTRVKKEEKKNRVSPPFPSSSLLARLFLVDATVERARQLISSGQGRERERAKEKEGKIQNKKQEFLALPKR